MADQPDRTVQDSQSQVPGGTREENRDVSISTEVRPRAVVDDKPKKRKSRSKRQGGIDSDATATRPASEPNPPGTPPDRNSL